MRNRVLIVEDEPLIALDLESLLKSAGFIQVDIASNMDEACSRINARKPDLVVLDAVLNGVSSGPVARILRASGIAFLVSSGHSAKQIEWLGDAPLLQKPFDEAGLVRAIKQADTAFAA
jgi:DNA-binding response OmpR family regulator